jgi:dTDP-4-amino-4,6-dideoxygalactose transaminase
MIPITRPNVGTAEVEAAAEVIQSGWLTQGPRVAAFEGAIAEFVGSRHAVATSNCTTALHLALIAAGVGRGDEVICPSFSFVATANAVVHAGARPVFVDIDPRTYNIDPDAIEVALGPRTRAIIPVDQIGLAADIPTIGELARTHGLTVIEDAAPSLGATVGGTRVGSISDYTCFSFHPRKSITTGEGGMITTNDAEAAARLRRLRSHGASTSDLARHHSTAIEIEEYAEVGYNYRMTDIQAAIGIVQMARLPAILAERRRLAQEYSRRLADDERVVTPYEPAGYGHTFQSYCVRLKTSRPRVEIMTDLHEKGIASRRGVMAIHLEPYYRTAEPNLRLPATEQAAEETLLLPLFVGMTDDQLDQVVDALGEALGAESRRHSAAARVG